MTIEFDLHKGRAYFSKLKPEKGYYQLEKKYIEDNSIKLILKRTSNNRSKIPLISNHLSLEINLISKDILQFIFRDLNLKRFELPLADIFPHHKDKIKIENNFEWKLSNFDLEYEFSIVENPFNLKIFRKSTKEIIFSTVDKDFFFGENYAEISTSIPTEHLFGLGERTTTFKIKSGIYTLYNKDLYGEIEDGKGNGKNRYGSHPMYLMKEKSGNYHINYLRNSYPMDVIVKHNKKSLTYKVVGGVLDFTLFLGNENPEIVTKKYHKFLGGYTLPPFWSMGFHQCRWGYKNLNMIEDVIKGYTDNDIPLDTVWMDIDYMNDYQPFTVDESRYDLDRFKKILKEFKKKFVMIIEPTIGIKHDDFPLLKKGKSGNLFIKNSDNVDLLNKVWPGRSHFIDYFNPNTNAYWNSALTDLHKQLDFSGIWLDMNEIAAFEAGQVNYNSEKISCYDYKNFPYIPGTKEFETATICPNAKHFGGLEHIQIHNYYPNQQAKLTYEYLENELKNSYPFILTRANGPGMGKYAAHWSGDNYGTNEFLKFSISEVLNSNLFGIPMSGADICGFGYDTPEYLCSRWYQMGVLYPFSRSHSHMDYYRKEPYLMGEMLKKTTQQSLIFRYSVLKYYYALFMKNNHTGTLFKPLFFEFYADDYTLNNFVIDNMFMIGDSLLAVPNLNVKEIYESKGYFPAGNWFDLRTNKKVNKINEEEGELVIVSTNLYEMPAVFLRGGKTIFRNDAVNKKISNSFDLDNNFDLYIAVNSFPGYNTDDESIYSYGSIPALKDYNSRSAVENCMAKNCFIEIIVKLNLKEKIVKINFKKAEYYDIDFDYVSVNNLYLLGFPFNFTDISKISSEKYLINQKNEDCLLLSYSEKNINEGKILIGKGDVEFIINLK